MATVMRDAGRVLLAGVAVGAILSLVAGRAAEFLLFELKSSDLLSILTAAGVLFLIGAGASFVPAYRAAKSDPMEALRSE